MILASENIQTLAKLGHETLLEMPARWLRCPWQWWWGGGCLLVYQLMFDSLRSALDFRGNMSGKSMRSILLSSLVSAVFVWKENSCPVVACLRSANSPITYLSGSVFTSPPPPPAHYDLLFNPSGSEEINSNPTSINWYWGLRTARYQGWTEKCSLQFDKIKYFPPSSLECSNTFLLQSNWKWKESPLKYKSH